MERTPDRDISILMLRWVHSSVCLAASNVMTYFATAAAHMLNTKKYARHALRQNWCPVNVSLTNALAWKHVVQLFRQHTMKMKGSAPS